MNVYESDLQEFIERAPELLCLDSGRETYRLITKLTGGDDIIRKSSIDLEALIDPSTGDFYQVIQVDEHPFQVMKLAVNIKKREITLHLTVI
jgi:hypothetical protein